MDMCVGMLIFNSICCDILGCRRVDVPIRCACALGFNSAQYLVTSLSAGGDAQGVRGHHLGHARAARRRQGTRASIYLSVYIYLYLSIYRSLSIYPLSTYIDFSMCLSISPSIHTCVCMYVYTYLYVYTYSELPRHACAAGALMPPVSAPSPVYKWITTCLYTILPFPILYGLYCNKGWSGGETVLRNSVGDGGEGGGGPKQRGYLRIIVLILVRRPGAKGISCKGQITTQPPNRFLLCIGGQVHGMGGRLPRPRRSQARG